MNSLTKEINYTWNKFETDIAKLIRRIKDAKFKPNTIVGIATGGLPMGVKLKNKLGVPLLIISTASYEHKKQGQLIFNASFTRPIKSPVLVVDDICDTGHTMETVCSYLSSMGLTVKSGSLFYKEHSVFKPTWTINKVNNNAWIKFCWE